MLLISVLAFYCLISAIITYGLGIFVYAKNPASAVNRLFLAAMLAAAYWAAGEFMIWQSTGYEAVRFWLKMSAIWPLAIAFTLHFILVFTDHASAQKKNQVYLVLFLYLPAGLFSLLGIFTDQIYTVRYQPALGYIYVPESGSLIYQVTTAFIVIVMSYAISVGLASWIRTNDAKLRRQNFFVTISIIVAVISGALSGLILPACGIYLPNLVFIGMIIFSSIIAFAIIRYHLFTLSPETAVPDILRTIPDGLLLTDMNDRVVSANASVPLTVGADYRNLFGKPVGAVIPEQVYTSLKETVLAQGTVADFEADLDQCRPRVVSISGSLVRDPAGKPAGIVLIIHDITHRRAQEKALRKASEKISLLNQLTRHDISNLVTALSNYLTLLSGKIADDPVSGKYLSASINLVEKITNNLQFAGEYQEIGVHEPTWQPLAQVISRAVNDLTLGDVSISLEVDPVEIYADPLSNKVIYNLLENSIRHGGHVTKIRITSAEMGDRTLLVVVQDDGVGIINEEKERIFERGFGKNTGLGLTLSREILAVTGISIRENGHPGNGARFEIRIPPSAWRPVQPLL